MIILFRLKLIVSFSVFHEQRDSMFEQYETIAGVFAQRAILARYKHDNIEYEGWTH